MPLPEEPVAWKPTRTAVKIARPTAREMTLEGMVRRTRGFLVEALEGDLGAVGVVGRPEAAVAVVVREEGSVGPGAGALVVERVMSL